MRRIAPIAEANQRTRCKKTAKKTMDYKYVLTHHVFAKIRDVPRLKCTRDADCNQARFLFWCAMPKQDAVAVSLAAKRKTDGYGFSVAVRNRKLLDLQ